MKGMLATFLPHLYECFVRHDMSFVVVAAAIEFREIYAPYKIYSIPFSQDLKSDLPKFAIGPAQMNNF